MHNPVVRPLTVLLITGMLSGCSVIMAASGDPEPNFGVIQPGATRAMVEKELGAPYHVDEQGSQRTAWYEYELGNAPNGDRALANFALDVYSLLLWEIIATPRELMMGDDYKMSVVYGPGDRVLSVHRSDPKVGEESPAQGGGTQNPVSAGTQETVPAPTPPAGVEEPPETERIPKDRPPSRPVE